MNWIGYLPLLFCVVVLSAAAQTPREFPLNQQFVVISLNGQNYDAKSPTLTVKLTTARDRFAGAGFAGCNSWNGRVDLDQEWFGVGDLMTTKKFCFDQMATESSFLGALKAGTRWRTNGQ